MVGLLDDPLRIKKKKRKTPSKGLKKLIVKSQGNKCKRCGASLTRTGCEIHHKSGNSSNIRPDNLVGLCPNCHSKITRKQASKRKKGKKRQSSILDNPLGSF